MIAEVGDDCAEAGIGVQILAIRKRLRGKEALPVKEPEVFVDTGIVDGIETGLVPVAVLRGEGIEGEIFVADAYAGDGIDGIG